MRNAMQSIARGPERDRGSFLLLGAGFLALFLLVGALGVDVSRLFMKVEKVQSIADGAALSGAQALNQPTLSPRIAAAYTASLRYIENHQGVQYAQRYHVYSPTDVEGIYVAAYDTQTDHPYIKVGVTAYGEFEPFFLPRGIFGDRTQQIARGAVARVEADSLQRIEYGPYDCVIYADTAGLTAQGNNLDTLGDLCSNGNIVFDGDTAGQTVIQEDAVVQCENCAGKLEFENAKRMPVFTLDDPAEYDVVFSAASYATWPTCAGGRMPRTPGGDTLAWTDGEPVCVDMTSPGEFEILEQNKGQIQLPTGDPVGIYVEGSVTFTENGGGIYGGLYATGDVTTLGNNYTFTNQPDKLGGLTLWAEGNLVLSKNNVTSTGILGAHGNIRFLSLGGGTGPFLTGVVLGGGEVQIPANSQLANIVFDSGVFDPTTIDFKDWLRTSIRPARPASFNHTLAYLVQ